MNSLEWSVVDATSDVVSLKNDQNGELQEMSASSFLAQCTLSSPKSEEVLHPGWPFDFLWQQSYLTHVTKVRILHALDIASFTTGSGFDLVNLYEKPGRTVRAKSDISIGALILVPNAVKVVTKLPEDSVWEGEVCVSTPMEGEFASLEGVRFVLTPLFSKEMPCLAWAVKRTADERSANMKWSKMKVSDIGVAEGPREHTKFVSQGKASAASPVKASPAKALPAKAAPAPPETKAQGKASAASPVNAAREFSLEIPVLINSKALVASEELLVHRPHAAQKRQQQAPVKLAKIMRSK